MLAKCPDQPCPAGGRFKARRVRAYRFMHNPETGRDFEPPAVIAPRSINKCTDYALSFFDDLAAARRRFSSLAERIDVEAKFGGYIGAIELVESDGLSCTPNATTRHLDLHPAEAAVFTGRVLEYHPARVSAASTKSDSGDAHDASASRPQG
jgi:hypothetical protein